MHTSLSSMSGKSGLEASSLMMPFLDVQTAALRTGY